MSVRTVSRQSGKVARKSGSDFRYTLKDVERISQSRREPQALAERRSAAWAHFNELPLPSLRDEPWRRTDLRGLPGAEMALTAVEDTPVDPALLQPLAADQHGALLVIRPGHAALYEAGGPDPKSNGVIFTDWATAIEKHAAILETHLGSVVSHDEGKFAALVAAFAADGVLLYVPAGVHVEQPLHSVLWTPGGKRGVYTRVLCVVEEGASVTFVHETASPSLEDESALHAGIVEVKLGANAQMTFVELQNLGEHVWNFTHERAKVARDGRMDWIFGGVGSRLTKNFTDLDLEGEGAEGRMSGFYFASGTQHLDHDTQQNHRAANTTSDLLFKGALVERSRSVWQGMIYVAPGAQKTDGYQANRNLVLSKRARADSIPGLEILADDVRCTHGATIGQLEEEPIFYLMSRGLTRPEAERLVIDGFFTPIMDRVPFEGVRERFQEMIDTKIGTG
jgi:Fe-S cluster assembly protein SufD